MEALDEKLAQFPRGTSFLVSTSGEDAAQALAAIRQLAERQGLILADSR
jgi:phosphotransferase system HPr-like phosphotransfer protein